MALKERDLLSRLAEKEQQLLGESKAEQQVAASLRLRELALRAGLVASQSFFGWQWGAKRHTISSHPAPCRQGEEDLLATLRKRDHAILKQEKKVEEMVTQWHFGELLNYFLSVPTACDQNLCVFQEAIFPSCFLKVEKRLYPNTLLNFVQPSGSVGRRDG